MACKFSCLCGGCLFRELDEKDYQEQKKQDFLQTISGINQDKFEIGDPVFIKDGSRRRAALAFRYAKGKLVLGFNQRNSLELVDIDECLLLTPKINANLKNIRSLLEELCRIKISTKKGKKIITSNIQKGDIIITEADNGLDIVLDFADELNLEHRMAIFEHGQKCDDVIRITQNQETIIEKAKPYIRIADVEVFIPAGTFLQASKDAEKALIDLVMKYAGESGGRIADLFCGVGTFSYPLAQNKKNQILAVDSSKELLEGFQQTINKNQIPNIKVSLKNLFKYPLDEVELKGFDVVLFDPPRAGALEQVKKISLMKDEDKPNKIIAISCNPNSFKKDANVLIEAGYKLMEVTMVDQFIYSNHVELVALFVL